MEYIKVSTNELYHHGVLGMKWGVRRFQKEDGSYTLVGRHRYGIGSETKSKRQIKKRMNDVDKAMSRNAREIRDTSFKTAKYTKKLSKVEDKGETRGWSDRRIVKKEKLTKKLQALDRKSDTYKDNIEKGRQEIHSLIETASKNGYTVSSKEVVRNITKGREYALALIGIGKMTGANGIKYKVHSGDKKVAPSKDPGRNVDKLVDRGYNVTSSYLTSNDRMTLLSSRTHRVNVKKHKPNE